jgi:hypothetical protein
MRVEQLSASASRHRPALLHVAATSNNDVSLEAPYKQQKACSPDQHRVSR